MRHHLQNLLLLVLSFGWVLSQAIGGIEICTMRDAGCRPDSSCHSCCAIDRENPADDCWVEIPAVEDAFFAGEKVTMETPPVAVLLELTPWDFQVLAKLDHPTFHRLGLEPPPPPLRRTLSLIQVSLT